MKPSEPFILFLQVFLCRASTLDHASSTCFVATSFEDNLLLLPVWKAATWDGPAHVFPSTATAAITTDSTSYLSSVDIEPYCGHGEASRMKPSEPFILFLQVFLCRASTLDHASSTCFVATSFEDNLLLLPVWKAATWDGPAHVFPSTATAAITTDSTSYLSSVDIEPYCGHGEASRMKPSEPFILFLQVFLCRASTLDHASSTCFVATSFEDNLLLLPVWKAATWDGPAHVFPSTATAAITTDSTSYLSSVDIEPYCGHGEASRMKPSEPFILFLQVFLCRASTLDHASSTCFVATSFEDNLLLLPVWKAATWDGPAHVFPSTATAAITTDSTSYLSSVDIEPYCGHGEASRMKPSEPFILFLQVFLCRASTLDHASSTCFVATSFEDNLLLLPVWKAATWDGPAHVFPSTATAAITTDSTSYLSSVDIEPYCGHGEASRMKPSEPFILFLQNPSHMKEPGALEGASEQHACEDACLKEKLETASDFSALLRKTLY
ncbi:hypothetical protein V5799_006613 [Amblyomma americanum]|uniref:Secreted protein n=1 Tax=Amblyomma americanum TaxID=6943 RepID=A0AAQ4DVW8_AMBAM